MPFPDGAFDRVWTQHATMNIAEKRRLFAEIHRVLRPGGLLALHEVLAGPHQPIHFPVPWAADASISFLQSPEELRSLLTELGFREEEWVDVSAAAPAGFPSAGPALAATLTIGPRLAEMSQNLRRNLGEGRLALAQAVFARP
jgi:SAM-dependent methyltransferase